MSPLWTRGFILIWIVTAAQTTAWALYLHLPGFLQDLGASEVDIGIIIGLSAMVAIGVRPWVGTLMDRRGRRPVLLAGALMATVASLLYMTVTTLGLWLVVVRIFHGFAEGFLFAVVFVYGADVVPDDRRSEGLAVFGIAGMLPFGIAGVLGDWLLANFTFQRLFLVASAFGLVALVTSAFLPEVKPSSAVERAPRQAWMAPVLRRYLLPLWWLTFAYAVITAATATFLKTYVGELGFGSVGAYFLAMALTATVVRLSFLRMPYFREKWVILPAFALYGLSLVVLALAQSSVSILLAGFIAGLADGLAFPVIYALVVNRAEVANRGVVVAVFIAVFDVGTLVGSPALGAIITGFGYTAMYSLSAALAAGAGVSFWLWDRWATHGTPPPSARALDVALEAPPREPSI